MKSMSRRDFMKGLAIAASAPVIPMKKGEGEGGGRTPQCYGWATEANKESLF